MNLVASPISVGLVAAVQYVYDVERLLALLGASLWEQVRYVVAQNAAILGSSGKLDDHMHVFTCCPLRVLRIKHGEMECGVMCLDLLWSVITLANLSDEVITVIAVSAGRDAEL